jgi:diguanylate cyclase (GGDEF)-like protein
MNPPAQPRPELGPLREKFIARARDDARQILQLCRAAESGEDDGPAVDAVGSLLHRLAGTAGTLGFHALGQQARRLGTLAAAVNPKTPPPERQRSALLAAAEEFAHALDITPDAPVDAMPTPLPTVEPDSPLVCIVSRDSAFASQLEPGLRGFGYRTRVFTDELELALLADGLQPAAVIARAAHGKQDIDQIRGVRAAQGDPAPILLVAPEAEFTDYLAAVRAGAEGFFIDPLDLPALEARMHYLIERRRREGLRVMLVDDDTDLLEACAQILEAASMVVATASQPSEALALLPQFRPELVLMDIRMPQCTGPELAQIIRLNEEWLHVPIVYMSTQSEGADQLLATRKAGEAFVSKPIDAKELIATVSANGRRARQMVDTASKDTLTGVLKHSFIKEHLASELERAHRALGPTCAVMIDIDNFKNVNDVHGHLVGDVVIRALANLLRQRLRVIDGVGRLGGEEFLVVLSNCDTDEALLVVDSVRDRFSQIEFAGKDMFHCTFSAGIAQAHGTASMAELLAEADRALYEAKETGRNRVVAARVAPA